MGCALLLLLLLLPPYFASVGLWELARLRTNSTRGRDSQLLYLLGYLYQAYYILLPIILFIYLYIYII